MEGRMRVAVMGAGGLGGLLGGLLAESGHDVALVARGDHLEAIRSRGLTLTRDDAPPRVVRVPASDRPEEIGAVDLVLFCVKTYDVDEAAEASRPLVADRTTVLPFQNGVETPERLVRSFGRERVAGGVSYLLGRLERPGVISYGAIMGGLLLGELGDRGGESLRDVAAAFRSARLGAEVVDDIYVAMWEKLVLVCATGGVMAFMRLPIGRVLDAPEGTSMLRGVMDEAAAVARAAGVPLPERTVGRHVHFIETEMAPRAMSSQLVDLLAGRRLELESLNGFVVRLGRRLGVETPLNLRIYRDLLPYIDGAPVVPAPGP